MKLASIRDHFRSNRSLRKEEVKAEPAKRRGRPSRLVLELNTLVQIDTVAPLRFGIVTDVPEKFGSLWKLRLPFRKPGHFDHASYLAEQLTPIHSTVCVACDDVDYITLEAVDEVGEIKSPRPECLVCRGLGRIPALVPHLQAFNLMRSLLPGGEP